MLANVEGVRVIDILGDTNDVVDAIVSCENIVSSSLHGIILADAFGLPVAWVEFSDNVIGDGFKFIDYFESVGRYDQRAVDARAKTGAEDLIQQCTLNNLDVDLGALLEACPFLNPEGFPA